MIEATTLLAANTDPVLREVTAHLSAAIGVDVRFDETMPFADRRRAVETGQIGVLWACGLLTAELLASGRLDAAVVAAPVFAGQLSAVYHSVLIARPGGVESIAAAAGGRVAINEPESWSGNHGLAAHLASEGLSMNMFRTIVTTGSHRVSIAAVSEGRADVAAIDHTVWDDFVRSDGAPAGVSVIGRTADWPAPPFSLSRSLVVDQQTLLAAALESIGPNHVAGLTGIEPTDLSPYQELRRSILTE